ncbi:MAG: MGMT family protein [Spirochaetes bacterium]|nr:MGMT family protein [Spirochaetota bacterium]
MKPVYYSIIKTAWGKCRIIFNKDHIISFHLPSRIPEFKKRDGLYQGGLQWVDKLITKVQHYFNGEKVEFDLKHVNLSLYSCFLKSVYQTLSHVKFGQLISYQELSLKAGFPTASRAAGNAMAGNPIPLIIPCHRVIRSDGNTGNFGYGRQYKIKMLQLEKSI